MAEDIITLLLTQLGSIGFFEFLLPWLFTFAVIYGLLIKAHVFGDANQKVSAVIAMVIAFFITPYAGPWLAGYFATLSTEIVIVLAGILTVVLFAAMIGWNASDLQKNKWGLPLVVILAVVVFFFALGGEFSAVTIGSNMIVTIIFVVILLAAVWFIISGGESKPSAASTPTGQ